MPSIKHLHIWGCLAEARPYRPHERKLNSRTVSCYFVGYHERSRGYKFYDPTSRSFFETGNARFLEDVEFEGEGNKMDVVFGEEYVIDGDQVSIPIAFQDTVSTLENNAQAQALIPDIVLDQDNSEILPQTQPIEQTQQPQEVPLRRSTRERRSAIPDDYIFFLQEHEDGVGLMEDDLTNFYQALHNSNSQKWIDAMNEEMKYMKDNNVWDLIQLPEGSKPIDCKWILKPKEIRRVTSSDIKLV